jgi:CDP-diacylglycerol pyrophosphatase
VTRGRKRARIVLVVAGLAAMTTFATLAVGLERLALWQVVRACVVDFKLTGAPFPCLRVDLSGGDERGQGNRISKLRQQFG